MFPFEVFPIDWRGVDGVDGGGGDSGDGGDDDGPRWFEIMCFGKTPEGASACVRIRYPPYFFVECPQSWTASRARLFVTDVILECGADPKLSLPVSRTTAQGFTNNARRMFVQLAFPTLAAMRRAKAMMGQRWRLSTYEASVDPVIRFFHVRSIQPAGWLAVASGTAIPLDDDQRETSTDVEVATEFLNVGPSDRPEPPPIVLASWDIEAYSTTGAFPNPSNRGDVICAICTTFQRVGEDGPFARHAAVLGGCAPVPGVDLSSFNDEAAVIDAWLDALAQHKADVLVAWNSFGFDYKYVYERCRILVDEHTAWPRVDLAELGKAPRRTGGKLVERNLTSAAYGANQFSWIDAPGIFHLDLMVYVKKEYKLDKYSLQSVSTHFLGDAKLDLSPAEMFVKFRGNDDDRADIVRYCVKDTELPLRLVAKLSVWPNLTEMSNATAVPVEALLIRGQQIKVFSQILRKARSLGFVVPDRAREKTDDQPYEGATVLDACTGAYLEDIVCALDFASLYPSIIRAHNMCPSTLVLDPAYDHVPGVEYYRVETPKGTFSFAQKVPSILPALLDDLATFRASAKRAMAEAKSKGLEFEASLQNGRQLAYKVSMNSAYGFFGASVGYMPCLPLAMAVTSTGRAMIQKTRALVETLVPGSRVVYGDTDSVMVIFDVGEPRRLDMRAHFEVAERTASQISAEFLPPNELEFEKAYFPYLLFSKKRYCGMMYTRPDAPDSMDIKGLQIVRRDSCPLVKTVSKDVLDAIMTHRSAAAAVHAAKHHVTAFLNNAVPLDQLVVSKALRDEYKQPESQPHYQVAQKIGRRRGFRVPPGQRVAYVFVDDPGNADGLQASRAEDPEHVQAHGLPIDLLHYMDSQLSGPLKTLLDILEPGTFASLLNDPDVASIYDRLRRARADNIKVARRIRTNAGNNQKEITRFFFRD